jgi:nucleoside-diphosphate-sugar epimerase
MKKVMVTGGSGFLGGELIRQLVARGVEVKALARSEKAADQVRSLGATPVRGDLFDRDAVREGMAGCDAVFHSAAYVEVWGSLDEAHRVNVLGTSALLDAARAAGVPRFVHVSTEAVLVDGGPIRNADETAPRPPNPLGIYPTTKGQAEERVLAANSPELLTTIVRPRFIWGKGDTTLMPKLIEAARAGQFRWVGGGRHLTSTCHVANVCEGLILAAERGKGGSIYFVTDGEPVEFRSFLTAMARALGADLGDKTIPKRAADLAAVVMEAVWRAFKLEGRPPITRTVVALFGQEITVNDAKARRELGYEGKMTRERGLAEMAAT